MPASEWAEQNVGDLIATYQLLQSQVQLLTDELAMVREAQARERAEKQRLESRLDGMLALLPAGVVLVDTNYRISELNAAAKAILGDVTGDRWPDALARAVGSESPMGAEVQLADGRWISVTGCDLEADGALYMLVDCTEQHQLGEKIAHYKRLSAVGEMMAQLAHQIRTPLSAARLSLDCIRRSDDITEIYNASTRIDRRLLGLQQLLDDLLIFSRNGDLAECTVDLTELMQRLANDASHRLGERVRIDLNIADDLEIHGNPELLFSALDNLINNAAAVEDSVRIHIAAHQRDAGNVQILFSDDGPGIPEDATDSIFEPFFTTSPTGSGLGLAVVKTIVEAHGGSIQLVPSSGACFLIQLPVFSHGAPAAMTGGMTH